MQFLAEIESISEIYGKADFICIRLVPIWVHYNTREVAALECATMSGSSSS